MSAVVVSTLAGAGLLVLPRSRLTARRLSAVLRPDRPSTASTRLGWRQVRLRRPAIVAVAALLGLLIGGPALAVAAAVAAHVIAGAVTSALTGRTVRRDHAALLEAVSALAADVRAGRPPTDALAVAAASATGSPGATLRDAATAAQLGGDVPAALRGGIPPDPSLNTVAAAWTLSSRTGASLADVLDRVERELRASARQRDRVRSQLAGPRTTAGLLAVLPLLGLLLGAGMGAHPVHVLLHTGPGAIALVLGSVLDAVGVWWTDRIVRAAGSVP